MEKEELLRHEQGIKAAARSLAYDMLKASIDTGETADQKTIQINVLNHAAINILAQLCLNRNKADNEKITDVANIFKEEILNECEHLLMTVGDKGAEYHDFNE